MRNTLLLFAASLCLSPAIGLAQSPKSSDEAPIPTITISKSDSIALALSPISGPEGATISKLVRAHLSLSGFFNVTEADRAAMLISGADGGSLQGKVADHSGGVVLSRTYSGSASDKAAAFANDIVETLTGKKGLAGTKIAFAATQSGKKEIYTASYDGTNVRQITHDGTISVAPSLSPDGSRLVYTSYLKGYADIYSINLASGARERIVKYPGTNSGAAYSPDGSQIACTLSKDGNPELYVLSASGGSPRRLTRTKGVESSPTWSPDGREIIYSSDDGGTPQLYRISSSGGTPQRLPGSYPYCTKPSWSPDGKRVAYNIRQGGIFKIAVLDLGSGSTRVLTEGSDARDPIWAPNSRHLLYTQEGNLFLLDAQNSRKVKVIDHLGSISEPTWSR